MSTFPLWVTEHRAFPVSTKHTISISPYTYGRKVWTAKNLLKSSSFLFVEDGKRHEREDRLPHVPEKTAPAGTLTLFATVIVTFTFLASVKVFFFLVFELDGTVTAGVQNWQILTFYECLSLKNTDVEMEAILFKPGMHACATPTPCVTPARSGWQEYFSMLSR